LALTELQKRNNKDNPQGDRLAEAKKKGEILGRRFNAKEVRASTSTLRTLLVKKRVNEHRKIEGGGILVRCE